MGRYEIVGLGASSGGWGRRLLPVLVALVVLAAPSLARAATHVPATTYSFSTTWGAAGSPYIVDGDVRVAAGATLSVEPGVVVKFNGLRSLKVDAGGALDVEGASGSEVTFTSLKDDAVGGDDGGDGPTEGSPGDWARIYFAPGHAPSVISHAIVRYGGYGPYGAIVLGTTSPAASSLTIEDTTVFKSKNDGLFVMTGTATVRRSSFVQGSKGVEVQLGYGGRAVLEQVAITDNSSSGFQVAGSGYSGAPSTISESTITGNGTGIYLQVQGSPAASWPYGHWNNIYDNGGNADGKQLNTLYNPPAGVDWSQNYLGDVYFWFNAGGCDGLNGHLAYTSSSWSGLSPPKGPLSSFGYGTTSGAICVADRFWVGPDGLSSTPFDPLAPHVSTGQTLGFGGDGMLKRTSVHQQDPVNSASGNFSHQAVDLEVPGAGVSFAFTRSYNSLDASKGTPFGGGWTHNYAAGLHSSNGDVTVRAEDGAVLATSNSPTAASRRAGVPPRSSAVRGGYELARGSGPYAFKAREG